jgi:hypothetical protein
MDIIYQPSPEERAPKSGLPKRGISMVSKSATADFDSRVSKDGRGQIAPATVLRDAVLRTAPQDDESGGCDDGSGSGRRTYIDPSSWMTSLEAAMTGPEAAAHPH